MRLSHLLLVLTLLSVTYSCKTSKNNVKDKTPVATTVLTDTVTITPKDIRNYRGSVTKLFDLVHTKLEVSFDFSKQYMYGKANVFVTPHYFPQGELKLDAKGMEIKEVALIEKGGTKTPLKYLYDSLQLKITLPKDFTRNDTLNVFIDYVAKPNEQKEGGSAAITSDKGLYFINPLGKEPNKPQQVWTQGETESNSTWFPTIDKPNQRMTEEIYMTVVDSFVTLSNGLLVDSKKNADGTRTDHWKMSQPHAPYLVMMAAGKYAVIKDTWHNIPVDYYVEERYRPYAKEIFGAAPEMLEFYSNLLGVVYPWEKYSQITARDYVSGAMENTTANLYFPEIQRNSREMKDKSYEYIVAHELFHQWFGDYLTTESWSNLTLNEGFANYGEYLWLDHKYGRDEAEHHRKTEKDGYFSEAMITQESLIRFYYEDRESMFDAHSYNKGGLVLNMLRTYVGDEAFFASLKLYLETNKFSAVELPQLRMAFEKVTGEDLNWFFNQWYLTPGHPVLNIAYSYNDSTKLQTVNITQTASKLEGFLYKLPITIDMYSGGKVRHEKVVIDEKKEAFTFSSDIKPDLIVVDPSKTLLATVKDSKGVNEYIFQFKNAKQYADKYEALAYLLKHQDSEATKNTLLEALNDPYWALRQQAANDIKMEGDTAFISKVKATLWKMAKTDIKSTVAAEAVHSLSDLKDKTLMDEFKWLVKEDRSYIETAAALDAINDLNADEAYHQAEAFKKESNSDVAVEVCKIVAKKGKDNDQAYFENMVLNVDGYGKYQVLISYSEFLKERSQKMQKDGANTLETFARYAEPWYLRYAAAKGIHTLVKALDNKVAELKGTAAAVGANNAEVDQITRFEDELKSTLEEIKKNEKNKNLISRYKALK